MAHNFQRMIDDYAVTVTMVKLAASGVNMNAYSDYIGRLLDTMNENSDTSLDDLKQLTALAEGS